jgi:hypothetical protein
MPLLAAFSITLLLSALLLFLIQPMFAKVLLPSLGGTPGVWNTCMVFFQAMLLAGYAYAHLGARWLSPKRQAQLHVALLALSLLLLPLTPAIGVPPDRTNPVFWLLGTLFISLGVPFFMLSASAPLLQRWFAASGHARAHDPYFLYAASNLGSLAALIGYPVLVEPLLALGQQMQGWSIAYAALAALFVYCGWLLWRSTPASAETETATPAENISQDRPPVTLARRARWVLLAFVPSSLMLGVTTYVTTDIAAAPLLWIVPLSLYLLSFVIVFSRRPILRHDWMVHAQAVALLAVILAALWGQGRYVLLMAPLHALLFFASAMVCHGELAKDRPATTHLTEFYMWMSVGGVLGGLFNALAAPMLFTGPYEYPIALTLACLMRPLLPRDSGWFRGVDLVVPLAFGAAIWFGLPWLLRTFDPALMTQVSGPVITACIIALVAWSWRRPLRLGTLAAVLLVLAMLTSDRERVLLAKRSFFGIHKVTLSPSGSFKLYKHGTTTHGAQSLLASRANEPLTYFTRVGPIGRVFVALDERLRGKRIGVAGLGIGTLTCYAKPGQRLTFYEIDPTVLEIARDSRHFTYVSKCGGIQPDYVLGDARLTLAAEPDGAFTLLILDAFSSDAIPVHLVTKEALELYLRKLSPDGVMAFNISNRYLDIAPMLAALARQLGLEARMAAEAGSRSGVGRDTEMRYAATWVVMARNPRDLGVIATAESWSPLPDPGGIQAWTDAFSNVLSVLRPVND